MNRPSYRDAVEWVALNDSAGDGPDVEAIDGMVSVLFVADLFGVERDTVRDDVVRLRENASDDGEGFGPVAVVLHGYGERARRLALARDEVPA